MIAPMTDGGVTIGGREASDLRHFLAQVATLHPVAGDGLGAAARRWQELLAPYAEPARGMAAADNSGHTGTPGQEWWEKG